MLYLVTAVHSPLGRKVATALLKAGHQVLGTTDAGWQLAKPADLTALLQHPHFRLSDVDLCSRVAVMALFAQYKPDRVLHLGGRYGLCRLDKQSQHCVDATQRLMLNLLDAAVRYQTGHFVYCQAVPLFPDCGEGRERHQELLRQVEMQQQLLAHTYSLCHPLSTSGVCFKLASEQWCMDDDELPGYYGRDVHALARQLLQLLQQQPMRLHQVNPYFGVYQAATVASAGRRRLATTQWWQSGAMNRQAR